MKKITFLLLILYAAASFGQDNLTFSLNEFFDGSTWVPMNRINFIYDDSNNLTEKTELSWNAATSQWVKTDVSTYAYNSNNNSTVELYQNFNGTLVVQQNRTTNTYNSEGQVIQFLDEDYLNSNWVNTSKVDLEYNNGIIVSGISSEWDGVDWSIGEDSSQVAINYNVNGTVSFVVNNIWDGSSWFAVFRTVYSYDGNNRRILEEGQFWDGSAWAIEYKLEYTYDSNGNALTEKYLYPDNGVFEVVYEETNTFDTSQLMADFAHPFKDRNGIDNLFIVNGIVNKILTTTSSEGRITYNYGEATASTPTFHLADVRVYPSPVTDVINVSVENGALHKIEVYSLLGKQVFTSTKSKINVKSLAKGVYLLKIHGEDGSFTTKKIIKN
jgi:hypothetical protein